MVIGDIDKVLYELPANVDMSRVYHYISIARNIVIRDVSGYTYREQMSAVDSTYMKWRVSNYPIADSNMDGVVDADDIVIELYDKDTGNYSIITDVSSVDANNGLITLSNAYIDKSLYATYRYYPNPYIKNYLDRLVELKTAILYLERELTYQPDRIRMGGFEISVDRDAMLSAFRSRYDSLVRECMNLGIVVAEDDEDE